MGLKGRNSQRVYDAEREEGPRLIARGKRRIELLLAEAE